MIVGCSRCEREYDGAEDCCTFCGFDPLTDPARFGPFHLEGVHARGAMSVVFKAFRGEEIVALKVLQSTDPDLLDRFEQEAGVVGRLKHPNLVRVLESGEIDDHAYLVMEFVDGPPLAAAIRKKAFPQAGYASIGAQAARGLGHAHQAGFIHRDITPGNILLTQAGVPKVADFGLAMRWDGSDRPAAGTTAGTPVYMSPEQAAGLYDVIDPRSDIYSLGAVLYEAVAGRPPFQGGAVLEILRRVQTEQPPWPKDVHPDLVGILRRAMEKDPGRRFATMREFAEALEKFAREQSTIRSTP